MQDFLRVFFGEVGEVVLLDNLIHMCLVLCTGNAAQTKFQRWAPEIFLAGERSTHNLFALVKQNVVTDTCLCSGFPVTARVCGRNKTDLRAARQNKCESAYSVSLFQGWQWERLTFFLCWWNFMKCKFCGWFLVQVEEDLLLLQQSMSGSELWSTANQVAGRPVSPGCEVSTLRKAAMALYKL